jgi:hypothetical protein
MTAIEIWARQVEHEVARDFEDDTWREWHANFSSAPTVAVPIPRLSHLQQWKLIPETVK